METLTELEQKPLWTKKDTCTYLGITPNALDWALHAGTAPPSAKIFGRRMFRRDDVLSWVEEKFSETNKES